MRVWVKYTFALYKFVKETLSDAKWQKTKQKQEKTETGKLTNKVTAACLQYPEDHWKRGKCPSGFHR